MFTFAAALTMVASASGAAPAPPGLPRDYKVSYDRERQRFCVRAFGNAQAADGRPDYRGTECRSEREWAAREVRFVWRGRAKVAVR